MKTIYLVRHGKAVSRDTDIPDYERTLIERGKEDSVKVAARLSEYGVTLSLLISSPAPRALQTARIFAKQLKYNTQQIKIRKIIYDQVDGGLLDIVHKISDKYDSVMLVGHNPSIEEFTCFLVGDIPGPLPTCGVVGIECDTKTWMDISQDQGKLTLFESPKTPGSTVVKKTAKKMKDTAKKMKKKDIEKILAEEMRGVLEEADAKAVKKVDKLVKKSSRDIAKKFIAAMKK